MLLNRAPVVAEQKPARRVKRQTSLLHIQLADLAQTYHVVSLIIYLRVWLWHFTPAAASLPGAKGWGWFFRYLTFCSFTLQLGQLIACVAARIPKDPKRREVLRALADDISCALFGLAHAVTLLYYVIHSATQGDLVEGGAVERPPWLGFAVHIMNTIFAWGDLLLASPRSFSRRSSRMCTGVTVAYLCWILLIRQVTGSFPYPFLNKMPFPTGFAGVAVGGVVIFRFAFAAGATISRVAAMWKPETIVTAA